MYTTAAAAAVLNLERSDRVQSAVHILIVLKCDSWLSGW